MRNRTITRCIHAAVVAVLLYPIFEFFVWTQVVASYNCPKRDSLSPEIAVLSAITSPATLLVISQDREYFSYPFDALNYIVGPVRRVAYPMSRIAPNELRESFSAVEANSTFLVIAKEQVGSSRCAASAERIAMAMSHLTLLEHEIAEGNLRDLEKAGSCLSVSATNSFEADYLYLVSKSTRETAAGLMVERETQLIPIGSTEAKFVRARHGKLLPDLPVSKFLVTHMTNGYVPCE